MLSNETDSLQRVAQYYWQGLNKRKGFAVLVELETSRAMHIEDRKHVSIERPCNCRETLCVIVKFDGFAIPNKKDGYLPYTFTRNRLNVSAMNRPVFPSGLPAMKLRCIAGFRQCITIVLDRAVLVPNHRMYFRSITSRCTAPTLSSFWHNVRITQGADEERHN
jgi:hypothetical protein